MSKTDRFYIAVCVIAGIIVFWFLVAVYPHMLLAFCRTFDCLR